MSDVLKSSTIASQVPGYRPATMKMVIQSGMLKTLGINLYTSIAKVLVEFIANAYDSDATKIEINIPFERIQAERKRLRDQIKSKQTDNSPNKSAAAVSFEMLAQVLTPDIKITLTDDGHGMTTEQVEGHFLPLNRSRRMDETTRTETRLMTESGKRFAMGRKGLGKLAGFGAAQFVSVRSKRAGQTHATTIKMGEANLNQIEDLSQVPVPVTYEDGLDPHAHGTTITLHNLKGDALKDSLNTIRTAIARSFYAIKPEDFEILINGEKVTPELPDYEFIYPKELTLESLKSNKLVASSVQIEDLGTVPFNYFVGFRKRNEHLPAKERGARIYCNNRLAAGPTLFNLGTGMHSFHSQDYMECVIEADEFDRGAIDLINTSRTQFKEGNDLIDGLAVRATEIMKAAIAEHAKFREAQAQREIEADPKAQMLNRVVGSLPRKTREPALRLLRSIAAEYGVGTEQFDLLAPIVVNTVNASEVLIRLIELGSRPETLDRIAVQLRELAEIEKVDALKHYRGRRSGIQALLALEQKGEEQWNRTQTEKELHELLKKSPWLIRPEFSNYLTSDEDLNKVVSKVASAMKVDKFATILQDDLTKRDETRPDLVFLMSDPLMTGPHVLNVVELKSVSKALSIEHYDQLDEYMFKIEQWCLTEIGTVPQMHGYLIGAMPTENATAVGQRRLLKKWQESTPQDKIKIVGVRKMIQDALTVHLDAIKTLEQELSDDDLADVQVQ